MSPEAVVKNVAENSANGIASRMAHTSQIRIQVRRRSGSPFFVMYHCPAASTTTDGMAASSIAKLIADSYRIVGMEFFFPPAALTEPAWSPGQQGWQKEHDQHPEPDQKQ